jgi:hypothetical protein
MTECIVRVGAKGLTYSYGSPLEIGDEVLLPPVPWGDGPWKATVTGLGRGDYDGPVRSVICRVAPDREVTP